MEEPQPVERRSVSDGPDRETNRRAHDATWIGQHQVALWRYLRFLGCPAVLAEDLVQDAFLVALEKGISELDPSASAAWLRATARNMFRVHLRTLGRRPRHLDLDHLDLAWVERRGDDDDYRAALRVCVAALEARDRRALEMRYARGASREEMACSLGISKVGVKGLLRRVRHRLRACVEGRLSHGRDA